VEDIAPDGTRRNTETCRYDGAGRKTKVIFLSHNADIPILYGVEEAEHAYGAPGAVTLTVAYDDRELAAESELP